MRKLLSLLAVLALLCAPAFAQTKISIKGKVLDETGQPVPFATIKVKGDKQGVSADGDGVFTIRVVRGAVLEVNAIGFGSAELMADGGELTFKVKHSSQALSEVIVSTAFGVKRSE